MSLLVVQHITVHGYVFNFYAKMQFQKRKTKGKLAYLSITIKVNQNLYLILINHLSNCI